MHGNWMLYELRVPGKQLRLAQRRAREKTETFRQQYRMRGGIEATNSIVKRVTGLGRLRVRGRPSVTRSALLKVAGWNVLRANRAKRGRRWLTQRSWAVFTIIANASERLWVELGGLAIAPRRSERKTNFQAHSANYFCRSHRHQLDS